MTLKLLAVGDLHLGRRPSRLPEPLEGRASELGPGEAWRRTVRTAKDEGVHVVALAGDVVEHDDDFFEAYRALHRGVEELAEANIQVIGVAGNHDVRVLPRLAEHLPQFKLLGEGGRWATCEIEAAGERLALWGWSFPQESVTESPLAEISFDRREGVNLGLLHCDRDATHSRYAPVSSAALAASGLDGWLLGHNHSPDPLTSETLTGYLGSVTATDPGQPGARGPWLLEIARGRLASVEHRVVAPLRWEHLDLDLTGLADPDRAHGRLLERLQSLDAEVVGSAAEAPAAVGLRVRLTGRTRVGEAALDRFDDDELRADVTPGDSPAQWFLERVTARTWPEIDLEELAGRTDPPGLLARRLLALDRTAGDDERDRLVEEGRRRLEGRLGESRFQALGKPALEEEDVVDWLQSAGSRLLDRLLAQGEETA